MAVVKKAIEDNPDIDEFIINIGGKERDGVTPEEAIQIWDIYKQYLPVSANINIQYSSTPPIKATYDYAKNHPDEEVLFILGAREGNDDDFKDISDRTKSLDTAGTIISDLGMTTNNDAYDFTIINLAGDGTAFDITLSGGTGQTYVGNMHISAYETTDLAIATGSAQFRLVRTASDALTCYRIS